jgi:hypothetical protein
MILAPSGRAMSQHLRVLVFIMEQSDWACFWSHSGLAAEVAGTLQSRGGAEAGATS